MNLKIPLPKNNNNSQFSLAFPIFRISNQANSELIQFKIWFLSFIQDCPPDLSQCVYVIDQALSVRALQELITAGTDGAVILIQKSINKTLSQIVF